MTWESGTLNTHNTAMMRWLVGGFEAVGNSTSLAAIASTSPNSLVSFVVNFFLSFS
jgi:hypothetical protein